MSNKVHIANHTKNDIHVIVTPNKDWLFLDQAMATLSIASSLNSITKAVASGSVSSGKLTFVLIKLANGSKNFVKNTIKTFKENGLTIEPRQFKKVTEKKTYEAPWRIFQPSYIGMLAGASDVTITIISHDCKKAIQFNSNSDHSWIVEDQRVVRAKYGTINQPSPNDGIKYWDQSAKPQLTNFKKIIDFGEHPDISEYEGTVVATFTDIRKHLLYSRLGKITEKGLVWNSEIREPFDKGYPTQVAVLSKDKVIQIHRSEKHEIMWYSIGHIINGEIKWNQSQKCGPGNSPSITRVNENTVLSTFYNLETVGKKTKPFMFYRFGHINGDNITWEQEVKFGQGYGSLITCDGQGHVIVMHSDDKSRSKNCSVRFGNIKNEAIEWVNEPIKIDHAFIGSISYNKNKIFALTSLGPNYFQNFYQLCGIPVYDNNRLINIQWCDHAKIKSGNMPAACVDSNGNVIGIYSSKDEWDFEFSQPAKQSLHAAFN